MPNIDVAVLGAGQAGLALSRCLAAGGIDHVLLERGEVGERWRSGRWEGLRLLTPNWMTRLPFHRYAGPDPDGFADRAAVVALLEGYARAGAAPVETRTNVERLAAGPGGYLIDTDRGAWTARAIVLATGACEVGALPDWATRLAGVEVLHASDYRRPDALAPGGVLVVGAAASGAQIARELRAAGRAVALSVGRHLRVLRRYRGRDIMHWLDAAGLLDESWHAVGHIAAARRAPSMQLTGRGGDIGLPELAAEGVRLVGRAVDGAGSRVTLAPTLAHEAAAAEIRRQRLLARIDRHIVAAGLDAPEDPRTEAAVPDSDATALDLRAEGIGSVVFATGYRRDYRWLDLPVLDVAGEIAHEGGITRAPGVYALGLRFLRRRSSTFIDGVGRDAEDLAPHIAAFLGARRLAA